MARLAWRDRWPLLAMQLGAVAGASGMVGGQVAQAASTGQVAFTTVLSGLFVLAIWLVTKGNAERLKRVGSARVPEREPLKLVLVGVTITAIVMWLTAGYGIFIAFLTTRGANDWHALGYTGVALCATGSAAMLRQARGEWADVHLNPWPADD